MAVLTIALVWVGLAVVAAVVFSRFVHFSESAAVDPSTSSPARTVFVLRGGRRANSRTRILSRAANHSALQLRWREARAVRRHAQEAIRKVG
jgi:uncharacterized protein (DUF2237 family)